MYNEVLAKSYKTPLILLRLLQQTKLLTVLINYLRCLSPPPPIVMTIESRMIVEFWARSPISFEHMSC